MKTKRSLCQRILIWRSCPFAHKLLINVRTGCGWPNFLAGFPHVRSWLTIVIGSRRLITYRRVPDAEVDPGAMKAREETKPVGKTADELNPFRKAYFNKFEA